MNTKCCGIVMPRVPANDVPVHIFRLAELGVDCDQFVRDVRPSFDRLEWDRYDPMKVQLAYLAGLGEPMATEARRIQEHQGPDRLALHDALINRLPAEHKATVDAMLPFRRRAMRKFRLERIANGEWSAECSADATFVQPVSDYRKQTRVFSLIESEIANHAGVLMMMSCAAETAHASDPAVKAFDAVLHQVAVVARPGMSGFPAPEGVHQDGAPFIVSALVVERHGVTGGVSKIYNGRGTNPVVEIQLKAGEGIFQADAGTDLWHEITPIELEREGVGHRMTFGIDLHGR
jgi:hypothetical protein